MEHKVKVTVIDKKLYPELQQEYCADPNSGTCPCYNVGDEFVFYRDGERDDFWHMGLNTLVKTGADPDTVAGGPQAGVLLRGLGCHRTLHLHGSARRFHHAGLDEGREHHDHLLLRRNEAGHLQDRAD